MYTPFLAFLLSEHFDNSCYMSVHLTTKYGSTRSSTMHVHNGRQCCQTGWTCSHIRIVRWCSCFHGTSCNTMITIHNSWSHGNVCIHSRWHGYALCPTRVYSDKSLVPYFSKRHFGMVTHCARMQYQLCTVFTGFFSVSNYKNHSTVKLKKEHLTNCHSMSSTWLILWDSSHFQYSTLTPGFCTDIGEGLVASGFSCFLNETRRLTSYFLNSYHVTRVWGNTVSNGLYIALYTRC